MDSMNRADRPDQDDDFAGREAELAAGKPPVQSTEEIDAWARQMLAEQRAILERLAR
jgi:hypothetical protein